MLLNSLENQIQLKQVITRTTYSKALFKKLLNSWELLILLVSKALFKKKKERSDRCLFGTQPNGRVELEVSVKI